LIQSACGQITQDKTDFSMIKSYPQISVAP